MLRPGNWVIVSVKHQFKGHKIGVVESFCKDGHPFIRLDPFNIDPSLITKTCCIDPERGDTIIKITKNSA